MQEATDIDILSPDYSTMDLTLENKACSACARAKRKCGRQIPSCGRCQTRGVRCEYTTVKVALPFPSGRKDETRVASRDQAFHEASSSAPGQAIAVATAQLDTDQFFDLSVGDQPIQIDEMFPLNSSVLLRSPVTGFNLGVAAPPLPWYLEPGSWDIDHIADSEYGRPFASCVLKDFIEEVQSWLARWVSTGTCPFIHSRIYTHQIPRCVQDAYTTLSTYQNRTPENKTIITGLVEERIKQLLNDQPKAKAGAPGASDLGHGKASSTLTPFEHLSRVHALTVYQAIGLYDGDIRLRHVAETQIPTLNSWLRQLIHSGSSTAKQGTEKFISSMLFPPDQEGSDLQTPQSATSRLNTGEAPAVTAGSLLRPEDRAWYAWLFAETIRRTWFVACCVQTIYLTLQVRWAPCPGGLPLTARGGVWSAGSAYAWAAKCGGFGSLEDNMDFIRRDQAFRIFQEKDPDEVDEFTRRMLEMTFGMDKVEQWRSVVSR